MKKGMITSIAVLTLLSTPFLAAKALPAVTDTGPGAVIQKWERPDVSILDNPDLIAQNVKKEILSDPDVMNVVDTMKTLDSPGYFSFKKEENKEIILTYDEHSPYLEVTIRESLSAESLKITDYNLNGLDKGDIVEYKTLGGQDINPGPYRFEELTPKTQGELKKKYINLIKTIPAEVEEQQKKQKEEAEKGILDMF